MPTDEQNRQKFEEAIRSRYGHASMSFERDDVGGYVNSMVHAHWEGWQARDAEVQALREALAKAERSCTQVLEERDDYAEGIEQFTHYVSRLTGTDFGEHTLNNQPGHNALDALIALVGKSNDE